MALIVALSAGLVGCEKDTPDDDNGGGGQCTALGNSCGNDGQCCGGLKCLGGICDAKVSCQPIDARCGPGLPCCGTGVCTAAGSVNICNDGRCGSRGHACGSGRSCCGVLSCRSGVCTD